MTYSSTDGLRLYVNCGQDTALGAAGTATTANTSTIFGADSGGSSSWFPGTREDIRLYNRAIPQDELCLIMRESTLGEPRLLPPSLLVELLAPMAGNLGQFFPFFSQP
jgi:hypothetical protein